MASQSPAVARRDLFRFATALQSAAPRRSWVRPPYALPESEFLLACTRCGECRDACPTGVVRMLGAGAGLLAEGTPAMALASRQCALCDDWPCVTACAPGALVRSAEAGPPQLAAAQVAASRCLPYAGPECGACADTCPVPGALSWNGTRPVIDPALCSGCGICRQACITEPKAIVIQPLPHGPS